MRWRQSARGWRAAGTTGPVSERAAVEGDCHFPAPRLASGISPLCREKIDMTPLSCTDSVGSPGKAEVRFDEVRRAVGPFPCPEFLGASSIALFLSGLPDLLMAPNSSHSNFLSHLSAAFVAPQSFGTHGSSPHHGGMGTLHLGILLRERTGSIPYANAGGFR